MSSEYKTLIRDLHDFAEAVKTLAFKMPAPNAYTPQFVQLALAAQHIAYKAAEARRYDLRNPDQE